MVQQGQTIELMRRGPGGERLWAYRYRTGGRGSKRVQRGGFACEQDAREALERELERLRREARIARRLTLAELVETYLAQHDVQPVTIEKLRYLLSKATTVFGERKVGELTSQEIAEWRMRLSPGYRFEATQALRQVLQRAVAWGMIDVNPAKVGVDNPVRRRKEHRGRGSHDHPDQHPGRGAAWRRGRAVARRPPRRGRGVAVGPGVDGPGRLRPARRGARLVRRRRGRPRRARADRPRQGGLPPVPRAAVVPHPRRRRRRLRRLRRRDPHRARPAAAPLARPGRGA